MKRTKPWKPVTLYGRTYLFCGLLRLRLQRYFSFSRGVAKKTPPTLLLFGGFRYSCALSVHPTGVMTVTDATGSTGGSLLGYFRPGDRRGFGVTVWPFTLFLIWR